VICSEDSVVAPFSDVPAAQQYEGLKVASRDVAWALNVHEHLNLPV
jgi:hypothetical protein